MIESITLKSVASYGKESQSIEELEQINYFYGANGSGKTTISRLIANESEEKEEIFSECSVEWKENRKLQTLVYNRDFVEKNFKPNADIPGVFTLGKESIGTISKIDEINNDLDRLNVKIQKLTSTLGSEQSNSGKKGELEHLEDDFQGKCWEFKQRYDDIFKEAFQGYRNSKTKFKMKFLEEVKSNEAELKSFEDLKKNCSEIFTDSYERLAEIETLDDTILVGLEEREILAKKVIGKDDVDIASMIKRLGNSDWVKQGRVYYEQNDDFCPFCQQKIDTSFEASLNQYFDETYLSDINEIENLEKIYNESSTNLIQCLQKIISEKPLEIEEIDSRWLESQKRLIQSKIEKNKQLIQKKKREASLVIKLESLKAIVKETNQKITNANDEIKNRNKRLDEIDQEKLRLKTQIWKFVVEEGKDKYTQFMKKRRDLNKAIHSLQSKLSAKEQERNTKRREVDQLEMKISSINPTIIEMNQHLQSVGFDGFSINKSSEKGYYKIVRSDGTGASETLSEGERSFITFLYFYKLLEGNTSSYGITDDRVVVFDDPVSSLDSFILFFVSSLIRSLIEKVNNAQGNIKQIFLLTHNVYFHKETTFNSSRNSKGKINNETFWIVKKNDQYSEVKQYDHNPVKTSYELLWKDVKENGGSKQYIQNILRRILEFYFQHFGNISRDKLISYFSGPDKNVCISLLSWINTGSHIPEDDLYVACDEENINTYLSVFEEIFKKSGHHAHYNMMMAENNLKDT